MKRLLSLVVFMLSALLTYWVLVKLLGYLPKIDPILFAQIIMVHIIVHELCHQVVMESYGVKAYVFFLVILGGTSPWTSYKKEYERLTWHQQTAIVLAGPAGNVAVGIAAMLLYIQGAIGTYTCLLTVNVAGSLIVYNLLPIFIFDGGHFAKYLFNSVSEDRDSKFEWRIAGAILAVILIVGIFWWQTYVFAAWMVLYGLHFNANHDDPHGSTSRKAMTRHQQVSWSVVYVIMMAIGLLMLASTADSILPH